MKKDIRTLAALLIASATFVACSSDSSNSNENPQPVNPTGKYTMTINASKSYGGTTRALSLSGQTLNATWATTENVYVQKGSDWATGTLKPQANSATATLKGELSGITINAGDNLTLQFPKSGAISYAGQVGTLADIAAKYDFATASVTVSNVSGGNIATTGNADFENQQAIMKFHLLDKADDAAINPTALTVTDGTSTVELTSIPAATYTANGATNVLYVAFPAAGSAKTITLTATVGSDTYTYEKTGVTFTNGKYYEIEVKMTKQVATATPLDNTTTAWSAGTFAVPAGGLTYSDAITVSGDVTLTLTDGETLTLNKGISLASGATLTIEGNGTMNVNGTSGSTASTVAGTGTIILTSGTLTAKGGNGGSVTGDGIWEVTGNAGGVAINGAVTVNGGTLTATGGNGGSVSGNSIDHCKGGDGGAAISGDLTVNGGTMTTTNGTNGGVSGMTDACTGGAGGKAVAGTVTDNRP